MKIIIPAVILIIAIGYFFQLGLLLNSNIINGFYLSLIGVAVGLILSALYFIYRARQSTNYIHVLHSPDKRPWHQQPFTTLMTFLFSILTGMFAVTALNNFPDTGDHRVELFEVKRIFTRRFRNHSDEYLELRNLSGTIIYKPENINLFRTGQEVEVTMKEGLLGFSHAVSVIPKDFTLPPFPEYPFMKSHPTEPLYENQDREF